MSRIWGGIHLQQDCDEGIEVGKKIGSKVIEDMRQSSHTFVYEQQLLPSTSNNELESISYVLILSGIGALVVGIVFFKLKGKIEFGKSHRLPR